MTYKFKAERIFVQEDDGIITIGFSDDQLSPSKYLLLQKHRICDEQDKRLGMDKIYMEVEDQSRSLYGGLVSILQDGNKIYFEIDENASDHLKIDKSIEIDLSALDKDEENILKKLESITVGEGVIFQRR